MRILFLGDIVGPPGVTFLKRALPALVAREAVDLVIANAENASRGSRRPAIDSFGRRASIW
jgi:hypothetical protein